MKTKLISMQWRGSATVDPRFSAAMLPWSVTDIYSREQYTNLSIGIENGVLETYNSDFELQFSHQLKYIVGICKVATAQNAVNGKNKLTEFIIFSNRRTTSNSIDEANTRAGVHGIVYLLKNPRDPLLHIFLFESACLEQVNNLMHQMKDSPQPLGGSVGSIPSTFVSAGKSSSGDLTTLQRALRGHGVHSTPASNLKLSESVRNAHHDGSPSIVSSRKMHTSKSYSSDLKSQVDGSNGSVGGGNSSNCSSTSNSTTNLTMPDISASNSQFFEVMYVGKIKVSHKRVPFTFIDDALPKFKAYDTQRMKMQAQLIRRTSTTTTTTTQPTSDINNLETLEKITLNRRRHSTCDDITNSLSRISLDTQRTNSASITEESESHDESSDAPEQEPIKMKMVKTNGNENEMQEGEADEAGENLQKKEMLVKQQGQSLMTLDKTITSSFDSERDNVEEYDDEGDEDEDDMAPRRRDRSASIGSIPQVDQNRTMVLLVGKEDIRLISPDRKQVLLYKDLKDVASVTQGHKHADHFGIIIRDTRNDVGKNGGYIGYVFKCQSDTVTDDILTAISQSFIACSENKKNRNKSQIFSCEHCPMLWYHKLCTDIEGLNDKKMQTMIFRRIDQLSEDEQDIIMAKYYGAEEVADHSLAEQNQFLMMLLRAHSESRQQRHVHDTVENRSEFLNQYLGGSTIFMKAKRSLTSSFDHLLKRKNSSVEPSAVAKEVKSLTFKDDRISSNNSESGSRKSDADESESSNSRPRTGSLEFSSLPKPSVEQLKSPKMDIFLKVGNSPKEGSSHAGSWRQEMLQRVVTPSKNSHEADVLMSPLRTRGTRKQRQQEKRTKDDLHQLWKTAIRQTILLIRMEKENERLQARQDEHERKKIKLDYDEILPSDKQSVDRWDVFIGKDLVEAGVSSPKRDPKFLLQAIRGGVPRSIRGDVWIFLADQFSMNTAPIDAKKFPNYNTPYHVLLKSLTEHQHAIFIDLGRTFPNHQFYKAALGVGQLSLFNILKAYSILDPELGYCQGLGFICGVLLLHCEEEEAFNLLKHLMFRRQMRANYLPDMKQFQLQLYQLSRLVRDHIPDLYKWLDENDVSPTLYAAPWILTVFSSQFPLGFVTRIFDLLFLESSEVIFRVSIALLEIHKYELMKRDNFEEIMDYMKLTVPQIDANQLDKIMKDVFVMDIKKQLIEYQVEYNVLQEEICTTQHYVESLNREKENNSQIESKLQFAESSIAQLEKTRSSQQSEIQSLQMQVKSLETTVETLGQFMLQLFEKNSDIEIPGDVRRIVQQIGHLDSHRKKPIFIERKIGKSMSVNGQLGFPLKVLEELNESIEKDQNGMHTTSPGRTKSQFFENTYMQLRKQNSRMRPNNLDSTADATKDHLNNGTNNNNDSISQSNIQNVSVNAKPNASYTAEKGNYEDGLDSGIATPMSPKENSITSIVEAIPLGKNTVVTSASIKASVVDASIGLHHPFGNCEDVNFKYNGTTQLKSLRPLHLRSGIGPAAGTEKHIDGRS